ncbi:MAG: hypothetical protein RhofKO_19310 [Rhodothermales bacterium]
MTLPVRAFFLLGVLLLSASAYAQPAQRPSFSASSITTESIRIDGVIDEAAWADATPLSNFVQFRPTPNAAPSEQTEARVLVGPTALYVAMRMFDAQPEAINTRLARRDSYADTDHAVVVIDPFGDGRTGFLFRTTPGNVKVDVLFFDDIDSDASWDAVWDAATQRTADGWTAEFEIPLSQLRYEGGPGPHTWGLQLVRIHHRTGELSYWSARDPGAEGYVSQFGTMIVPTDLPSPRRFELLPYMASVVTQAPDADANPFVTSTELAPRAGLDVKWGLTPSLTLAGTINPDFGQVEADPAQVNLSGFELFFEERRPFFVEGVDAFAMAPRRAVATQRPTLLYTRRIGRSPQRISFVPDAMRNGQLFTDAPQQSTILGAAKISGQIGRFNVGVLNATTRAEYGRFQRLDASGTTTETGRALVEPLSNYLAARARGTYGRFIVGGLLTSVLRNTDDAAIADLLPQTASVAGVDVEYTLDDAWRLTAQLSGSWLSGSPAAITRAQTAFPRLFQRPDADHLDLDPTQSNLAGWSSEVNLLKTRGEYWTGGLHMAATSPGFDANAMGFQPRADLMNVDGIARYQQNTPRANLQSWSAVLRGGVGYTFGGERIASLLVGRLSAQLPNFWGVGFTFIAAPRSYDDRLTRRGPLAKRPASLDVSIDLDTDSRQKVWAAFSANVATDELGGSELGGSLELSTQPRSALQLSAGPEFSIAQRPRQYVTAFADPAAVATFGTRYVFGHLETTTLAFTARADWTFTPNLSVQLYARPFLSSGRYAAFKAFDQPNALRLPVYGESRGTVTTDGDGTTINPEDGGEAFTLSRDFTVRALQGNAVLRWEFRRGSTLFFVWQQQRDGRLSDGRFQVQRGLRDLLDDSHTNVFMVKLTYWLG